eukprot:TRINITY_DN3095_c0_g1_i3.p1 TRINITY_DN3095_c0_g1~~TRINITY_DN3095_c0_g1_i3.p1  ORF type:complete len:487 (+),score=114.42 TRINITY_DN3095_c0_g1_i3:1361-2821(+)
MAAVVEHNNSVLAEALIELVNSSDDPELTFQEVFGDCGIGFVELANLWSSRVGNGKIVLSKFVDFLNALHEIQQDLKFVEVWDVHARLVLAGSVVSKTRERLVVRIASSNFEFILRGEENACVFRRAQIGQRITFEVAINLERGSLFGRHACLDVPSMTESIRVSPTVENGPERKDSVQNAHQDRDALPKVRVPTQQELDDAEFARRLGEEDQIALNVSVLETMLDSKNFDCDVCGDTRPQDDLFVASVCNHSLCRGCAREYVKSQYEQMYIPVRCWMQASDCKAEIPDADIEKVLDGDDLQRYWKFQRTKALSSAGLRVIECINANCEFLAIQEASDPLPRSVVCEVCNIVFCPKCKVIDHVGMDCAEFRRTQDHPCPKANCKGVVKGADLKCECPECRNTWCWECGINPYHENKTCDEAMQDHFRNCPNCKLRTNKSSGCNHMRCNRCGIHWCYLCAKQVDSSSPYDHYKDRRSTCYNKCFATR